MDAQAVDAESLVLRLYEPGTDKQTVEGIAEHLRLLQLSPSGWQLADHLLKSSSSNVRFFAANTFTIKINSEGSSLSEEDLATILERLLAAYVDAVNSGDAALVIQKLCVALVALFFLASSSWAQCVRHVVCCLHASHFVPEDSLASQPDSKDITLHKKQLSAVLLFATTLAEDAQKVDHSAQRYGHVNPRIRANLQDTILVLRQALACIRSTPNADEDDAVQLLDCYQAWAAHAISELKNYPDLMDDVKLTLGSIMDLLLDSRMFVPTAVFLKGILADQQYTSLLLEDRALQLRELLFSPSAQEHFRALASGSEEPQDVAFGELAFAFGYHCAESSSLSDNPEDPLMELLHALTRTIAYDSFESTLGDSAIDFWECYNAHLKELDSYDDISASHRHWMTAIRELCEAVRIPFDGHVFVSVNRNDDFLEFHTRVLDIINDAFDTVGPANLRELVSLIKQISLPSAAPKLSSKGEATRDNFWSNTLCYLQPFEGIRPWNSPSQPRLLVICSKPSHRLYKHYQMTQPKSRHLPL
ncbi:hypothetical protein FH972_023677 [Carpinus fangiana]|uniref:Exportin-1/Importin-beta-like domain-containing protein n=1 Tax=Carpinus fangiana TaxID=176857 RepID=A0A5N6KWD5_9ROSI|nr:hypothetical protein FH972_023677 [Carpinus fangiana]